MNGSFSGFDMSILGSVLATQYGYAPGAGQQTGASAGASANRKLSAAQLAALPPWDSRQPKVAQAAEVRKILAAKSILDPGSASLKNGRLSVESDIKKLFTVHKAMDRLQTLSEAAARTGISGSEKKRITDRFNRGMKELDEYMTRMKMHKVDLIKGRRNDNLETEMFKAASGVLQGQNLSVSNPTVAVADFANAPPFDMAVTTTNELGDPVTTTLTFDFDEMGTTIRSLDNVAGYMNSKLAAEGFETRIRPEYKLDLTTGTYGWGLTIQRATGEDISFPGSPGSSGPVPGGNLIQNGTFSQFSNPLFSTVDGEAGQYSTLNNWTAWKDGQIAPSQNFNLEARGPDNLAFDTDNDATGIDAVSQSVQTEALKVYTLSWDSVRSGGTNLSGSGNYEVLWNNQVVATVNADADTDWVGKSVNVTGTGGQDSLTFRELGANDSWGSLIDNVRLQEAMGTAPTRNLSGNLATNGSFEINTLNGATFVEGPLSGWTTLSNGSAQNYTSGDNQINVAGNMPTRLGSDGTNAFVNLDGAVRQSLQTQTGATYQIDFATRAPGSIANGNNLIEVRWNNQVVATIDTATDTNWRARTLDVTGTGGSDTLEFRSVGGDLQDSGSDLDSVQIRQVLGTGTPPPAGPAAGVDVLGGAGRFENPNLTNSIQRLNSFEGWNATGAGAFLIDGTGQNGLGMDPAGQLVELSGPNQVLSRSVNTTAGQNYRLSLDFSAGDSGVAADTRFEVLWNGQVVGTFNPADADWETRQLNVTGTGGADTLAFRSLNTSGSSFDGAWIDNVTLQANPTPTGANLVSNGSFESGSTGWTQSGIGFVNDATRASDGTRTTTMSSSNNGAGWSLSTNVAGTSAGQAYALEFDYGSFGTVGSGPESGVRAVVKDAGGNVLASRDFYDSTQQVTGPGIYQKGRIDFAATGGSVTVEFVDINSGNAISDSMMLDNVSVRAIPGAVSPPPPPPPPPPGVAQGTELLVNGSFDSYANQVIEYGAYSDGYQNVQGWTSTADVTWAGVNNSFEVVYATGSGRTNAIDLDMDTGAADTITQTVQTEAGRTYDLSFTFETTPQAIANGGNSAGFEVLWNGTVVGTYNPADTSVQTRNLQVTGTGGQDSLSFREIGNNDGYGAVLSDVSLKAGAPVTGPLGGNLVSNGSFESDDIATNSFQYMNATGWTGITGSQTEIQDSWTPNPGTGQQYMELMNGGARQSVTTVAGQTYQLDFASRFGNDGTAQSNAFEVWYNGSKIADVNPVQGQPWQNNTFTFTGAGGPANLEFRMKPGQENAEGAFIDGVQVRQVMGVSPPPPPPTGNYGAELVTNGGFEADDIASNSFQFLNVTGWTGITGSQGEIQDASTAPQGSQVMELMNGGTRQSINTTAGKVYELNFASRAGWDGNAASHAFEVWYNGQMIADMAPQQGQSWKNNTFTFMGAGGPANLEFRMKPGQENAQGAMIDAVSVREMLPGSNPNLLRNGSFEADDQATGDYIYLDAPLGWTASNPGVNEVADTWNGVPGTEGTQWIEFSSNTLSQAVTTQAGQAYTFSFDYRKGDVGTGDQQRFRVRVNGVLVDQVDANGVNNWASESYTFIGTGNDTVQFERLSGGKDTGVWLDNVAVRAQGVTPPPPPTVGPNIVTNGSFETDNVATGGYVYLTAPAGWTASNPNVNEVADTWNGIPGTDGSQWIEFSSNTLSQALTTQAGQNYTFSFDYRGGDAGSGDQQRFRVRVNGQLLDQVDANGVNTWASKGYTFTATGNDTIQFERLSGGIDTGVWLDNVQVRAQAPTGVPVAAGTNIITNGSFEATNVATNSSADVTQAGWTTVLGTNSGRVDTLDYSGAPDGSQYAELDQAGGYKTTLNTEFGRTYTLDFDFKNNANGSVADNQFEVWWNGSKIGDYGPGAGQGWTNGQVSVVGTGGAASLEFRTKTSTLGMTNFNGAHIDDVKLIAGAVPGGNSWGANMVANGSFENYGGAGGWANNGANMASTEVAGFFGQLAGWSGNSSGGTGSGGDLVRGSAGAPLGTDGNVVVELDGIGGPNVDGLSQSVQTTAGTQYRLQFDLSRYNNVSSSSSGVEVVWNGQVVGTATPSATNGQWNTATFFVTGTGGNDTFQLREVGSQNDGGGALIDNVRLQANLGSGAPSGPPSADIASRTYGSDLIQDGGFEGLPNSFNALTGTSPWQSNDGEVEIWGAAVTSGYGYAAAPQGSQFLELDKGGELNEVYQDVTTEAGKTYQLDFNSLGRSSAPSGVSNTLEVLWNDEVIGTVTSAADGTWDTSRFDVIGTGGTDRLTFRETAGGNDTVGPFIDNVRLREVTNAPVDNPNDGPGILGMNGAAWGQGGSMRVVDMTSAKAGDKFSIQVNDKKERTFTITNTMTLRDLAAQIQREMGTAGTARVEMGPKGWRIDMDPKKGNRVEVFAGSVKGNALDDLGLAEGVARKIGTAKDSKRAAFVSGIAGGQTVSRGDGVNGVFRGAKGVNAKAIAALEFDPTLRIDEKEGAKAAIESLESSMRKVRLAYRQVNGELDRLASGAPQPVFSAREAARMAQYQSALNKLQAGPSTSMLFSGV